jgi:hypothetical protein
VLCNVDPRPDQTAACSRSSRPGQSALVLYVRDIEIKIRRASRRPERRGKADLATEASLKAGPC